MTARRVLRDFFGRGTVAMMGGAGAGGALAGGRAGAGASSVSLGRYIRELTVTKGSRHENCASFHAKIMPKPAAAVEKGSAIAGIDEKSREAIANRKSRIENKKWLSDMDSNHE